MPRGQRRSLQTVNGVRSPLDIIGRKGGYGTDQKFRPTTWHILRIDFGGSRFRVSFNGRQLFGRVEDFHLRRCRQWSGLWTKADSVMLFDQVTFGEVK